MNKNNTTINTSVRGVGYYNKEEHKDNKKITYCNGASHLSSGLAPASLCASQNIPVSGEPFVSGEEAISAPTPMRGDDVKRALIQLWDNGEDSKQRYKLKVRLNLADGTDADFVAALTKDPRNFIKHTADKEIARDYRDSYRRWVKEQWNVIPWLGKFHLIQIGYDSKMKTIQNEPNCFGAAWWDAESRGWICGITFYDFILTEFDLYESNITVRQRSQGCKAQSLWINPKYDARIRPKTWAQQRAGL